MNQMHRAPPVDVYLKSHSLYFRSTDDQEALFDQILLGQLEFPLPYWDNVSDSAKVSGVCLE